MRIVSGELRGRAIDAPAGEGTRPTTDRVREALFSSLFSMRGGFEDAVVLDAFAGSGALGIEAISRGARFCSFFEKDRNASKTLKKNLGRCGIGADKSAVSSQDVFKAVACGAPRPCDLVFLDPPYAYASSDVVELVERLSTLGVISQDAIIVYEHALTNAAEVSNELAAKGYTILASKKYGKTGVTFASMDKTESN